ncbi:MAG: BCAM0308 family protein [Acidobacteriota bacterium]
MRSSKRYSNQTFTKRVDHDSGRHRPQRSPAEPLLCERCKAVYVHRRWISAREMRQNMKGKEWKPARKVICPACEIVEEGTPAGYLYLEGDFFVAHRDELQRLIENEAKRARSDNPLARIIRMTSAADRLTVETTTEHLAQRLGHALEKAFGGDVRYGFSHENKLSRVWWHRDE